MNNKASLMYKVTSLILSGILIVAMMPVAAFAQTDIAGGVKSETKEEICVKWFSVDKIQASAGETITLTVELYGNNEAHYISFYKPITQDTEVVSLKKTAAGIYQGTFDVDDQTESGTWKMKYLLYYDEDDKYQYIYNSDVHPESNSLKMDFSHMDFDVVGTYADVNSPVLRKIEVDKNLVSAGETVTISAIVREYKAEDELALWYKTPSGQRRSIYLHRTDNQFLYKGSFQIKEDTEKGIWIPEYLRIYDANYNEVYIYNSALNEENENRIDMSNLNFEVVESVKDGEAEPDQDVFIVIFDDGYGKVLSTQRVEKGQAAREPEAPTNQLYIFDGWDSGFDNITTNRVISAKWRLDPNAVYDKEIHAGDYFEIQLESQSEQEYAITCNEEVEFEAVEVDSSESFGDIIYTTKTYRVTVNDPGSYLFYAEGEEDALVTTYKVKVNDHQYDATVVLPTCDTRGYTKHVCTVCSHSYRDTYTEALGHQWSSEYSVDVEATCKSEGIESIHCLVCDVVKEGSERVVPIAEHKEVKDPVVPATCTEPGLTEGSHCDLCKEVLKEQKTIKPTGHQWDNKYTIDKQATQTRPGSKSVHCTICGEIREGSVVIIPAFADVLFDEEDRVRIAGQDRFRTAINIADSVKEVTRKNKFDNIIVADGMNFADALAGTYLAKVKNAPIITVGDDETSQSRVRNYIKNNLKSGGTVYILGGHGAVSDDFEWSLDSYKVERIEGRDRFETNIRILEEAGVEGKDILVCSGMGFADSLSASAVGLPILLVDEELTEKQRNFLQRQTTQNYYIIGGTGAVNRIIEAELDDFGSVERVFGANRFSTSTAVAKKFFKKNQVDRVVLAYAMNFPDGLSGGVLAMNLGAPLILATSDDTAEAKEYIEYCGAKKVVTLGGPSLISDEAVDTIMK